MQLRFNNFGGYKEREDVYRKMVWNITNQQPLYLIDGIELRSPIPWDRDWETIV